nr:MAG TPA: hypothetical protein [Caudoviricetes sp.]
MAEYIDKAVALSVHEPPKSNRYYQTDNLDDAYGQGWDDALCSIEHIPAADVAPVVHSYWEHMISSDEENIDVCHNCKYPVSRFWGITKYCPNCGAKMDGKDEDDAG